MRPMKTKLANQLSFMPAAPASGATQSLAARLGWKAVGGHLPQVVVTEKALAALRALALPPGAFVRIGVVAGGCSGHTYSAAVDDQVDPADLTLYESGHLRIATNPASAGYLDGLQIDYSDDLIRSGFRFSNPKAGGSCGCGASFKASP